MGDTSVSSDSGFDITIDRMLGMSQSCFDIWFLGLTPSQKLYAAKLLRGELLERQNREQARAQVQIPDFLNVRGQWQRSIPSVLEGDK